MTTASLRPIVWRAVLALSLIVTTLAIVPRAEGPALAEKVDPSIPTAGEGEEGEEIQERDEWFYEQRGRSDRFVPRHAYRDAVRQARSSRRYAGVTGSLRWTEMGPHSIGSSSLPWTYGGSVPYSGRVTSIATHPTDARTAYIGTSNGGVWKTTNDGVNWTPLFDNQPSLAIGAVAVDPRQGSTVFAGTGEANFGGPSYFGTGLFKSTDGGATWTKKGGTSFDECHFSGIAVKPGDSGVVVVAVHGMGASVWEGWNNRCANRAGIWRSTDGGSTFTHVLTGGAPSDLAVSPNAGNVWYAGFNGAGIWKSTDSGVTWRRLTGLPSNATGRVDLDVAASTTAPTQVVYAAIASGRNLAGVFRSRDGGNTWTQLTTPQSHCTGQCGYDLAMAVDRVNPERAYFGGVYLNRYISGVPALIGWQQIHVDFHALAFDSSRRLWIGSDGGIYRTADGGATFSNLNGDLGTNLIYPGMSGSYAGRVYAGMQDNGTAAYTGTGSWNFVNWGDGFFTASHPSNPNPTYVTSQYLSLIKITNTRRCPNMENAGLPDAGNDKAAPFAAPVVMHPTNRNILYAGTYRIFQTTNGASTTCGGTQWSRVSQDFPGWVTAIAPAPTDPSVVYAATQRSATSIAGLFVTRGSATWTNTAGNGLPNRTVTDIAVHPTSPGTAWVTVSGFGGGHVYRTTNYGGSWTNVSGSLPDAPANAIVVDARTSPLTLYVGTDVGVFWSVDGGATWNNTSIGLPNTVVMDLILDPAADRLIAGTFGRGAWSAPARGDGGGGGGGGGGGLASDSFGSASAIGALPFAQSGVSTTAATTEVGEPGPSCGAIGKTVWYRYQPSQSQTVSADTLGSNFDTILALYRGASLQGLTQVACDDDSGGQGGPSSIEDVDLSAGQTYYFQVGGFRDGAGNVASGSLNFQVTGTSSSSSNDNFAGAKIVGSLPFSDIGVSTASATTENGETAPQCASIGKTIWYRYTPATNQVVRAATTGSDFDTVVGVYKGSTLGGLTEVACDDDAAGQGGASVVNVALDAGQTYHFQVGGFYNVGTGAVASGTLRFDLQTSSNDPFGGALTVSSLPYSASGLTTVNATVESGEFSPSCSPLGRTVWFRYVAPSNGTVFADTGGSNFDTVVGVWRGTSLGGVTEVACDDDGLGTGGASFVSVDVTAGQTYYFQVGGYFNEQAGTVAAGNLTFTLE